MRDSKHRSRSRSPYRDELKQSRHPPPAHSPQAQDKPPRRALPFGAREISRHDLNSYRPMFTLYLDIQKQIDIDSLDEKEVKGRWKSFTGKWNRGELAEGWYDPQTLQKAKASTSNSRPYESGVAESTDEPDYGPALPNSSLTFRRDGPSRTRDQGVSIPSLQDLRARDEQADEDAEVARGQYRDDIRFERRLDRKVQKERLDEIAPRAEAGTRERQLEKKREKADSNRAFAASKDGADTELRDAEVMGDEDSLGELKKMKGENERRKNERELRKEEVMRARRAEREARVAGMKEKEDRTMALFKEIARARFGGGES